MPRTQIPLSGGNGRVAEHNLYDLRMRFPTTGNIWFVDSGADSGGNGLSPESAVQTINDAVTLATANNGDIIIVMEGHAQTVVGAAGVAISKAGLTVVGLGRGRNRPVITFTTADAASFDISAASCHIENLVFVNGRDGQTAMVNVTAADVTIKDCEFVLADATTQAVIGILGSAASDRVKLLDLYMHGTADAGCDHAISLGAADDALIKGCTICGAFAVGGAIENSAAAINFNVIGNTVVNRTADGDNKAIVFHASTVGMIADNRLAIIDSMSGAPTTAAAAFVGGNYFAVAAGVTAGTLQ